MVPPDFTDQSSSKANCSVPTALPQLPPPFVIRAIALLTHVGLAVKCLSSLTTLSNKNSSYPTSEYLPPICLIFRVRKVKKNKTSILLSFNAGITAAATRISFTWRLTNPFHREFHTVFHHRQLSVISFRMYSLCSSTFCF